MQLGSKQYPDLKLDKLACEASRALGKSGQLESWAFPPDCCLQIPDLGQWGGGWGAVEGGCRRLNGVSVASPGLKTSIAFLLPGPGIGPQGAEDLA